MQAYGEIAGAQYKVRLHNIDSVMDCGISVYSPTIGRRNAMLCERSAGYNMTSFLRQWRHLPYSDWLKSDRSAAYRKGGNF
uniref:Uncharacterized protein n=1 Tax=Trichuris muris TaxID=70415 RepID=A0A5S6QCN8_TRIMR